MIRKSDKSMKISPYAIRIGEILTTLKLLETPEESVVQSALCEVDTFINKYEKQALQFLRGHDIAVKILEHLGRSLITRLRVMKVLIKLLALDNTINVLRDSAHCFGTLFNMFMKSNNSLEIEYASKLMGEICEDNEYALCISNSDVIRRMFRLVENNADPDVKNNCLKMLHCVVNNRPMRAALGNNTSFKLGVLNVVLQNPVKALRAAAVNVLLIISDFNSNIMQKQIYENNTVYYLFDILLEEEWSMIQNNVLSTIYNCVKYESLQPECLKTEKFFYMTKLPKTNPFINLNHVLGIMSVIKKLAEHNMYLQAMIDCRVYEVLHEYCKYDCDMVPIKFCEAMSEFAKNCYVIRKLATSSTLKEIEKILRRTHLPWIPYRQEAIRTLYLFLMNDPQLCTLYYKYHIIKPIQVALLSKGEMGNEYYKMTLEIFESMLLSQCLLSSLWTFELYQQFVILLDDTDEKIIHIAISVLQNSLCSEPYRRWFLEFETIDKVAEMLADEYCKYIIELLSLLKCAVKYKDLCMAVIEAGLVQIIFDYRENYCDYTYICDAIVNDIYRVDLSIKFYITGILDYTDRIQNGFCAYSGIYRPHTFPPEIETDFDKGCYTMLTVNMHGDKKTKHPCIWGHISVPGSRAPSITDGPLEEEEMENIPEVVPQVIPQVVEPIIEVPREPKMIYKLELPEPTEEEPITDYYLKKYVQTARKLMDNSENYTRKDKLVALAKFVACCLTGHEHDVPLEHEFDNHVNELKENLMTNYIPIGYLRLGLMLERALLFKVLADKVRIPSTLERGEGTKAWNEVSLDWDSYDGEIAEFPSLAKTVTCIIDLMDNPGHFMMKGTEEARIYCLKSEVNINKVPNRSAKLSLHRISNMVFV